MNSNIKLGLIAHNNEGMLASFFEQLMAEEAAAQPTTPADNHADRAAKSAADSAAFEAAERLFGENARVNAKLGE